MKKVLQILSVFLFVFVSGCTNTAELDTSALPVLERPEIRSENVYLFDMDTGQILWEKGAEDIIYPASITKLMTAIIAIEQLPDLEEEYPFTAEMMEGLEEANANRAGFVVGDAPTMKDYIYGDLLASGADCSRAIAYRLAGSEEAFVQMMNEKAKALGMYDTHFVNTSGLYDSEHYSTCKDLATLLLYCKDNETLMEMLRTVHHTSIPVKHFKNGLGMDNLVLAYINQEEPTKYGYVFSIPGFIGGKGGYTIESRYNLASMASFNNMNLMLITIHAYKEEYYPAAIADASTIYNWYSEHYAKKDLVSSGETYIIERVRFSHPGYVNVKATEDFSFAVGKESILLELPEALNAPIKAGEVVGQLHVYDYSTKIKTIDLIAETDCEVSLAGILITLGYEIVHSYLWVFGIVVFVMMLVLLVKILRYR